MGLGWEKVPNWECLELGGWKKAEYGSNVEEIDATVDPECAGQAADAVSADTQVKMEDAPRLLKIPDWESPDI